MYLHHNTITLQTNAGRMGQQQALGVYQCSPDDRYLKTWFTSTNPSLPTFYAALHGTFVKLEMRYHSSKQLGIGLRYHMHVEEEMQRRGNGAQC